MQDPIHSVLVVSSGEDMGYDEFAGAGEDGGVVAEIGVFKEDAGIFFVDADGVFDGLGGAGFVDEVGVHVVDCTFAVAAEGEGVGHVAAAVLA